VRHHPDRLELTSYPLQLDIPLLYADMDVNAHVNNVAIARLFEESRSYFDQRASALLAPGEPNLMGGRLARIEIDYLAEVLYPGDVTVAIGCAGVGRSSLRMAAGLFQNGRCVALSDAVFVAVDGTGRPREIAPNRRAILEGPVALLAGATPGGDGSAPSLPIARTDPRRREESAYPTFRDLLVMYGDQDTQSHVNNISIARYFEEGRASFFAIVRDELLRRDEILPRGRLARVEIDYLAEVNYPGTARVATGAYVVGRSSYRLANALFQDGVCTALCESVSVAIDDGRPTSVSQAHREVLESRRVFDSAHPTVR
jgi:acyl-CoA thioester hydrolase